MGRLESGCHSGASGRTFALGIEDALSAAVRGDTGRALAGRTVPAPFTIDLCCFKRKTTARVMVWGRALYV